MKPHFIQKSMADGEGRPGLLTPALMCVCICVHVHICTLCVCTPSVCTHVFAICILSLISHSAMKGFVFAKEQRLQEIHGEK